MQGGLDIRSLRLFEDRFSAGEIAVWLALEKMVPGADNICKQFGPRSGPTQRRSRSGSKPFDTLIVFLKDFFKRLILKKKSADDNKIIKISSMQIVNTRKG